MDDAKCLLSFFFWTLCSLFFFRMAFIFAQIKRSTIHYPSRRATTVVRVKKRKKEEKMHVPLPD